MERQKDDDDYPIKDPNNSNEYRHEPDGGFSGRNQDTGTEWSRRRNREGDWEDHSNR